MCRVHGLLCIWDVAVAEDHEMLVAPQIGYNVDPFDICLYRSRDVGAIRATA